MKEQIGFGLVGLGVHGLRYARHLLEDLPGARLVAVCRKDAVLGREWASAHGVRFLAEYQDLVADEEVDAVAVATPPDLNAAVTLAALEAGKPVLVEKPLAATLPEARSILAASRESGGLVMVAQTLRWNAVVRSVKAEAATLGRLLMLALSQRFEPSDRPWLDQPGPGGILLNTGIHSFDLVRHLSGREITEVWCRTRRVETQRTPDTFVATLTLEGGVLATVDNCRATAARSGRIELIGEKGQITGDHVLGIVHRIEGRDSFPLPLGNPVPTVRAALADFVQCALDSAPPPVSVEDGLKALEVVMACRRSHSEQRVVSIDEVRSS